MIAPSIRDEIPKGIASRKLETKGQGGARGARTVTTALGARETTARGPATSGGSWHTR